MSGRADEQALFAIQVVGVVAIGVLLGVTLYPVIGVAVVTGWAAWQHWLIVSRRERRELDAQRQSAAIKTHSTGPQPDPEIRNAGATTHSYRPSAPIPIRKE